MKGEEQPSLQLKMKLQSPDPGFITARPVHSECHLNRPYLAM